ncbi:MAG: metal ABC transporter permease [Planctomycetes bacterium]|nr:metal ABC transporter permease [Planctomycetota bacterium]
MTYLTLIVLLGTTLLGATAGVLGSFAVLRRRALMGDLLSHAALPGLCLAFLVMGGRHFLGMLLGALATGLAGVGLIILVCRWTRTKEDAALGIVLSTFFGAGIVLSSIIQNQPDGGSKAGLESYIFGQAAGMIQRDVWLIGIVAAAALLLVALLYKEFKLFSFDPGFAEVQGWPTLLLDIVMMGSLAVVTVIGLPAVGVVLMAAMFIIPGASARFWTNRLGLMLVLSGVFGALTGILGTLLSAGALQQWTGIDPLAFGQTDKNLPAGPLIVLSGTAIFLVSMFFAPSRGILARLIGDLRFRLATAGENLLRTIYELNESKLPRSEAVALDDVLLRRAWSRRWARLLVAWAARKGFLSSEPQGPRLTEAGITRAAQLVRAHRLWEMFLIRGIHVAPDHVDRDADSIEHRLTPELLEHLEADLTSPAGEIPRSPHAEPEEEPRV